MVTVTLNSIFRTVQPNFRKFNRAPFVRAIDPDPAHNEFRRSKSAFLFLRLPRCSAASPSIASTLRHWALVEFIIGQCPGIRIANAVSLVSEIAYSIVSVFFESFNSSSLWVKHLPVDSAGKCCTLSSGHRRCHITFVQEQPKFILVHRWINLVDPISNPTNHASLL